MKPDWLVSQLILGALRLSVSLTRADTAPSCSITQHCPEDLPCCGEYGECGTGAYCLGGCDPRFSHSLNSCAPAPFCHDKTLSMDSLDRIISIDDYLGNATEADWVSSGRVLVYNNSLLLTMTQGSGGTVLSSTTYMWYGNVTAKIKTGVGAGVVTTFVLMSDVKDEIDLEFIGNQPTVAQTNYFWQANPNPDLDNWYNITVDNTQDVWHTYEIWWTPDDITFVVDGVVGQVDRRADKWNSTSQGWDFPQTPARVQLSIWPGGDSSEAAGTIEWAGGPIDWNSPEIQTNGYDYAMFSEVTISCYSAGSATGKSYTYDNIAGTNASVVVGNKDTVLASSEATGSNTTIGKSSPTASGTASSSTVVPSGKGSGTVPDSGLNSGSSSSSSTSPSSQCSSFCQGTASSGSTSQSGAHLFHTEDSRRTLVIFAIVIAIGGHLFI